MKEKSEDEQVSYVEYNIFSTSLFWLEGVCQFLWLSTRIWARVSPKYYLIFDLLKISLYVTHFY